MVKPMRKSAISLPLCSDHQWRTMSRLAQDLIRLPQLAVLALQNLDPVPLRACLAITQPRVHLLLPHPGQFNYRTGLISCPPM